MRDGKLNGKYFVERVDGQDRPDSRYFVLNYATDPYARTAMRAYAEACRETHPTLSSDLLAVAAWYDDADAKRRRGATKPLRGTHGSGGETPSDDDLVELVRRRLAADPQLLQRLLADTDTAAAEPGPAADR